MKRVKGYLLILVVLVACPTWHSSKAMINAGAGWWCDEGYTWDDDTRTLQQVLVNCTWMPSFPYSPTPPIDPPFGSGSSGGSSGPTTFPDLPISPKLNCALQKYTNGLTQKTGKSFYKVNAWAFGKHNGYGWDYEVQPSPTSPGAGWQSVGGIANYTSIPRSARLYNVAFQGRQNFNAAGNSPASSIADNGLAGPISDFEMSLFAGAHELAHLSGFGNNGSLAAERDADWFGIFAVLAYRADGGSKCAGAPE